MNNDAMMTTSPPNKLVLNYHDAVLYRSDKELLETETAWLNDACIHFYLTVLQQRHPDMKFMDPSVITFLMHQCDEEDLEDFSRDFDKGCAMYIIPINDGHRRTTAWQRVGGGSHWSLLIVRGAAYFQIDSVAGSNALAAQAVAKLFSRLLGHHEASSVLEVDTPQQHNGYDCGIYALAAAEVLAGADSSSLELCRNALLDNKLDHPGFGLGMRRKILAKANEFAKDFITS